MRQIQIIFLKRLVTSALFYGCILILFVFASLVSYQIVKTGQKSGVPSFILVNHAVIEPKKMVFFIIPLFLSFHLMITDIHNRLTMLLKYNHAGKWWWEVFVSISLLSFVMTVMINGITILTSFLIIQESIGVELISYITFQMLMEWISFIVIGSVYHIFVLFIKREYMALFLTTFVFFLQDISKSILRTDLLSLPGLMALEYKFRYKIFTISPSDVFTLGVLVGATAILFLVGYILVRDKDFYWSA